MFDSYFIFNADTGEYELHKRGTEGRTPWLFDLGANVTFRHSFSAADLRVKLQVNNLLNQQRVTEVDEFLGSRTHRPESDVRHGHRLPGSAFGAPDREAGLLMDEGTHARSS